MMFNILLIIESLRAMGGTERQILELASRVDGTRFRIHLCTFEENRPALKLPAPHTVRVFLLSKTNSLEGLRQIIRLRAYIQKNKIDVIETFLFKAAIVGVIASWRTRCRVIVTTRRNIGHWYRDKYLWMTRLLNTVTTRVLVNAECVKSATAKLEKLAPQKIDVLRNGVDLEQFRPRTPATSELRVRLGIAPSAAVVGIVANLRPVKDIPLFLAAAKEVAQQVPEAVFLVIGNGPLKPQLEVLASEFGIRERVHFIEGVTNIAAYLECMQVGCLSSLAEGFSNAILEYMAAGLPAVATAVGGNAEAIVHGVTGYLTETRRPDEFAGYVTRLLQDEKLRVTMGRRALARCRALFDIKEVVRLHEEYWTKLIEEHNTCRPVERDDEPVGLAATRHRARA